MIDSEEHSYLEFKCPKCGYELSGLRAKICPECGTEHGRFDLTAAMLEQRTLLPLCRHHFRGHRLRLRRQYTAALRTDNKGNWEFREPRSLNGMAFVLMGLAFQGVFVIAWLARSPDEPLLWPLSAIGLVIQLVGLYLWLSCLIVRITDIDSLIVVERTRPGVRRVQRFGPRDAAVFAFDTLKSRSKRYVCMFVLPRHMFVLCALRSEAELANFVHDLPRTLQSQVLSTVPTIESTGLEIVTPIDSSIQP